MADEKKIDSVCRICGKPVKPGELYTFAKAKGSPMRWYHEKCVKEEGKNGDTVGKRH